ncbi:MAG: tripartite tricarboxylate transporter TctB family protein [Atribacterota bacterium]|nr:tripartite tricarboxylate transporter TctB family protein [Atribacterota bacterium]
MEEKITEDQKNRELEISAKDFISSIFLIGVCTFLFLVASNMRVYNNILDAPGVFPMVVTASIGICGILLLIDSIKRGAILEISKFFKHASDIVDFSILKRILIITSMIIIYGFLFVQHMHFTLATFIFLFAIMFYLKVKILNLFIISIGTSFAISFIFDKLFNIPLP